MKPVRSMSLEPTPQQLQYNVEQNGKVLAGNISFGSTTDNTDQDRNINCSKAVVATPAGANTEFAVAHQLGRIPIGYILISIDRAAIVYRSATTWTTTQIFLKCNGASANIVLLVI